jgi:L-asparaginase
MISEPKKRIRIAHLAGPTATIQNTPPLVTSNKARLKYGLPPRTYADGTPARFDALRAQRLAAPAKVYVEQFSAHPLEVDAAELYGKPDGYMGADGVFRREPISDTDKPVYEIELSPEDGLYPLPYMALQTDGSPWEEEMAVPGGPDAKARQGFFPDGSRSFEEIDRLSVGTDGTGNAIAQQADIDFFRVLPPGGFRKGLAAEARADEGEGDIAAETRGRHFFGYKPFHLSATPSRPTLAKATNDTQAIADSGKYDGLIWTQGSPQVEEAAYWFNLLVDTTLPICGNAAQRPQGQISHDGPKNIVDSVAFIRSRIWADAEGRNRCGTVVIQEQQFFAAREVAKVDARPGGYVATGGHGGILGQISHADNVALMYVPAYKHTYLSDVNIHKLPMTAKAAKRIDGKVALIDVTIKDSAGNLLAEAVPSVSIIKEGSFSDEEFDTGPDDVPEMLAAIEHKLGLGRLGGFITEGLVPYGRLPSNAKEALAQRATFMGLPFVRVGRGAPEGFADLSPFAMAGSNLTATKARLLLMAALMKLGALPIASDPDHPTDAEKQATIAAVKAYQQIFDTH